MVINGLSGTEHMPYGYRRWNGVVWMDCQVDAYNSLLDRIVARALDGFDVEHLVNGLYNLAHGFDRAGK